MSGWREDLKKQGGCGWIILAIGAAQVVGFIYFFFIKGGDPEAAQFQRDCWNRHASFWPGRLPDQVAVDIVQACDQELRIWRSRNR